jgi:hypothetical protein
METMRDPTAGFQNFLFRWLEIPQQEIVTYSGKPSFVYLENLAPLFDIDQDEGWTNVQALQIGRYQQQEIQQIAVEYLLGATNAIQARVTRILANRRDQELRDLARALAKRVGAVLLEFGWSVSFSGHGSLSDTIARWSATSLTEMLQGEANVDLVARKRTLSERIGALRDTLTKGNINRTNIDAPASVSQTAIELNTRRHKLSSELNALRIQFESESQLIHSIDHRIASASDLLLYKKSGVGRLENQVECPTCHRHLELESFALQSQSADSVGVHIEALKRDRAVVQNNLYALETESTRIAVTLAKVTDELRQAERALVLVNESDGPEREQLAKLAVELAGAERDLDRLDDAARTIAALESEIREWLNEASGQKPALHAELDTQLRTQVFTKHLFATLRALGHGALRDASQTDLTLDDQYTPYLDQRRLRSIGSASDQARLIAAYSVALALASEELRGFHPGFVLLDEPLQQNPDDPHRELFLQFIRSGLPQHKQSQVLVFT